MTFQSDQDDVGAGKLGDLENFRSQWQRELNEKNKEEIGEKQVTYENSEDDDEEEDDIHRKVSVAMSYRFFHFFILIGKRPLYEGSRV